MEAFNTLKNNITYNSDKSISVILNSANTPETNKGDCTFTFDWGAVFPDNQAYEVYWTLLSNVLSITSSSPVALAYLDLGSNNVYEALKTNTAAYKSNFLGSLTPNALSSSSFFRNDENQSPPIYLSERPKNNFFKFQVYNGSKPPTPQPSSAPVAPEIWTNGASAPFPNFILNLKFYPIEK